MFLPKRAYVLSLSFFIGLVSGNVMGQTDDINRTINLPKIMPVSPEAASLGKFGQIPVSYYRGVPNITVPLFQVKEGQIDLPVQLSYHAGGIKVEEMASTVGLSWALNAGGIITRTQKGQDDEIGFFNNYNQVRQFILGGLTQSEQNSFKVGVYRQYTDSEPDIFYYNFGGISGKFFCADDGKLYTSPRADLKITYSNSNFTIVDGKGITYRFSTRELTTTEPFIGGGNNQQFQSNTSWYLTQIEDPLGNKIDFTYTNVYTYFRTKAITTFSRSLTGVEFGCQDSFSDSYNHVSMDRPTIREISFSTGKIRFDYEPVKRLDAPDTAMRQITMLNLNNDTVKYYRLYTGYYTTNNIGGCEDGYGYRLRLDSLKEFGKNGKNLNPYKFTYNGDVLPCRLSNAQDHWGYFNGRNNTQFVRYQYGDNGPWYGANKELDSTAAKTGLLTVMKYPTGGRTEFTYEGNTTSYSIPAGFDPTHPIGLGGLFGNNNNHGGDYLLTFQSTFTVASGDLSPSGYVWATASLTKYIADPSVLSIITLTVTGSNGYNKVIQDGDSLHLAVGNYTITGTIETEYAGNPYCEFLLYLNKIPYNPLTYYNKAYGGVRIGQIRDYDFNNHLADVKTYKYGAFDIPGVPNTISSGEYAGNPDNIYYSYTRMSCPPPGSAASCCSYKIYNSVSNYPLLYSGASPVGYKNVTVLFGPNGSGGKQEYTYTSYSDYPDQASYSAPFFFASEYDWKKGLLLKSTDYKYTGSGYSPVKRVINEYDFHSSDTTRKISRGVVLGKLYDNNMIDSLSILYQLQVASYDVLAEAFNLSRDTSIVYDAITGTSSTQVVNTYSFSPKNFQLKRKQTIDSKGDQIVQNFKYSLDYAATGANNNSGKSIWNLQNKNIISAPIESLVTKIKGSTEYILYGNINTYRNDLPLVSAIYSLEERGTTPLSSFQYSTVDGSNNFTFFNTYKPYINQNRYTSKGMFSELNKNNDHKLVYLWDHNGALAIASIKNADSTSVAYSSFEAEGKGNWSYAGTPAIDATSPTGRKCYNVGTGSITKTGLVAGINYIITYWRKDGSGSPLLNGATGTVVVTKNGWTLYRHELSGITTITLSGSGYIDELRLHPAGAEMVTNTYYPLIGVSSTSDAANRISYYEYDAFGRLMLVRDQDRNVLKKICYNYAGQPEDCGVATYSSVAKSGSFTRNNCGTNGTGSSVTYNVAAGTYTSTINQADADQKAQNDVNTNGQAYANANGSCTWSNQPQSGNFTRNNCGTNGTGGTVTYTIAAGTYNSTISLVDANQQATNAVSTGGQAYANANAGCTWINQAQSGNFTRNNCTNDGIGGTITYNVTSGSYSSTISLADANQQAVNEVNTGGQAYANANATCTWYNQAQSGNFSRNNCGTNGTGGTVTYTIAANIYSSTTSLADANQQAINAVNAGGQTYANANAGCTWYNQAMSQNFTRNNCPQYYTGGTIAYNVTANTYSSIVSLAAANQLAQNDINANGQTYANTNANCIPTCTGTTCSGENRRCVYGVCETGIKVYTSSTYQGPGSYYCVYHYEFSDGGWSENFSEYSFFNCTGGGGVEN